MKTNQDMNEWKSKIDKKMTKKSTRPREIKRIRILNNKTMKVRT